MGIVAPASPFDRPTFDRGLQVLESMGFRVVVPPGLFKKKGYLAGSDGHRADLINRMFADPGIRAIVCARGGFGSLRILALLDFALIRENPKILVGFSDITALLSTLYTTCRLVTFHGPVVTTLADAPLETQRALATAVASTNVLKIEFKQGLTLRSGVTSAPITGGNLTTLCHLIGTPFEPNFKGHILFLEDRGEASYRIDRMLVQMKLAGSFEGLAGLVLGTFKDCGSAEDTFRIFGEVFRGVDIPILAGLASGHGRHNITIPMGLEVTLDADRQALSFHRPATIG
ncbi:MAG: LD-carboxypeptidase [Desulfobacterales bacterium]|nr:MAG: LD-carboxypeptidase [Desulfobacterales bacterium]